MTISKDVDIFQPVTILITNITILIFTSDSLNEEAMPNQRLSIALEAESSEANARLAYHCLKQLFNPSKLVHVEWSVQPIFGFLDKNEMWWPESFGTTLVLSILSMLPVSTDV